jgi:hypothetical protein
MVIKMTIRVSVRSLVEFILRSGDIDNRKAVASDSAMQEGSRIHRMIQRRMGPEYQAEVGLSYVHHVEECRAVLEPGELAAPGQVVKMGGYEILVEGRADGIITGEQVTVDEIKGTFRDLKKMKDAVPVHLAQAKCYAYMYARQENLPQIRVRMTYCHLETEELRYFHYEYTYEELTAWFQDVMEQYRKWADYSFLWQQLRQKSIKELEFPFPYRDGQKDLVTYVYQTIYHKRKLFIEAPTGVGKTISTVFPAVKAMGEGLCEKIFYLTAKTITRTVGTTPFLSCGNRG